MRQKSFLIVTTLTPRRFQDSIRRNLFKIYLRALCAQSHENWSALLIGDENGSDGKIIRIKSSDEGKIPKIGHALKYIDNLAEKPDYVLRLDDDDMISPLTLARASAQEFDCYADESHHFFDIVNSRYCFQRRPWLANTVIHKTCHIFNEVGPKNTPLLMNNHDEAWHLYYADKNLHFCASKNPVYLRTVSPLTLSVNGIDTNNTKSHSEIDWVGYNSSLDSFGLWRRKISAPFVNYGDELKEISKGFEKKFKKKYNLSVALRKYYRGIKGQ